MVEATPEAVMAVISDFSAYPEWSTSIRVAEVLSIGPTIVRSRAVRARAGAIIDEYVLAYSWSADDGDSSGGSEARPCRSRNGGYRLRPVEAARGSTTNSDRLAVPVIGSLRTRAERRILGDALNELKRRAEAR